MTPNWNPITTLNLTLCIVILILGYEAYKKTKDETPIYIAIAFGFFAISHIMILLGLARSLDLILVACRLLAYLTVIFILYRVLAKK